MGRRKEPSRRVARIRVRGVQAAKQSRGPEFRWTFRSMSTELTDFISIGQFNVPEIAFKLSDVKAQ